MNRRQIREQNKQADKFDLGDGLAILKFFCKCCWWCLIYSPFLITAYLAGEFLNNHSEWPLWLVIVLSVLAAVLFYIAVNLVESFADRFKAKDNYWYIPLKILVVLCVSGMPFLLGYYFVAGWVTEESLTTQWLVGGIGGLLLGVPAYIQVIVRNKSGY